MNVTEDSLLKYNSGEGGSGADLVRAFRENENYVYLAEAPVFEGDTVTKARVHIGIEQNKAVAFVFTSEQVLQAWCQSRSIEVHFVQVPGDHLCANLKDGTGVVIDSGTSAAIRIGAETVTAIRAGELVTHPLLIKCGVVTDMIPVDPHNDNTRQVQQYQPTAPPGVMVPTPKEGEEGGSKSKAFARRAMPTQFFSVPQGSKPRPAPAVDSGRPRTYTSSNLKKIVRPPGSGEDEGQK